MVPAINSKTFVAAVAAGSVMASNGLAATTCKDDTKDYSSLWGVLQRELQYLPNNKNFVIQSVSGNITIVDKCSFKVSNFTLYPAPGSVQWYGSNADKTKDYHISWDAISSQYNPSEVTFTLNSDVNKGETPMWSDIQYISLYGETDKVVIARARVNTDGAVKGETNTTSGGTVSDTDGSSPSGGANKVAILGALGSVAVSGLAALLML